MKRVSFFLALSVAMIPAFALAANPPQAGADASDRAALEAAFDASSDVYSGMEAGQIKPAAQKVLNILVHHGISQLRDSGETTLADQIQAEWDQQVSPSILDESNKDLGDHNPLFPWLASFYSTLSARTLGAVSGVRVLSDVNTLNYALPVVFSPVHGQWRVHTAYDRIEYRKHFIPFANVLTYWTTLEVCNYYAANFAKLCGYGATKLEFLMGRYWAPGLSDRVFAKATRNKDADGDFILNSSPLVSKQDFVNTVLEHAYGVN